MDRAPTGELNDRGPDPSAARRSQAFQGRTLFAVVAAIVFIADRISKRLVVANVQPGTERAALPHVWITNTQNPGAAYAMNWNMNVQREITSSLTVTLGYVGSRSVHLPVVGAGEQHASR